MVRIIGRYAPTGFIQGDTIEFTVRNGTYPSSEGWAINYYFQITGQLITAPGVPQSDGSWTVTMDSTQTATFEAKNYRYQAKVSSGADQHTVEEGIVTVELDLITNPDADTRSEAAIALEAINAVILKKASSDQQSYTIDNRSLTRYSIDELMKLQSYYKRIVDRELALTGSIKRTRIQTAFQC